MNELMNLLTARRVALYLVALVAGASAEMAWRSTDPVHLVGQGAALAFVVLLAEPLDGALSAVGAAGLRRRSRIMAFLLVPLPTLFAIVAAWSVPAAAGPAVSVLTLLQIAVLLVSEALGLEVLALFVALALVLVAAAGGGLPALVAPCGYLLLVGLFLALDHAARRLAPWPGLSPPPLRQLIGDALRLLAAPVVLLALALLVLPDAGGPRRAEAGGGGRGGLALDSVETRRAYQWLAIVALAGAGTLILVFRWIQGRGSDAGPIVEMEETHVEADELLEPEGADDPRYAHARGRVIRAYVRFLARARQSGLRLGAELTPREIEARVRRPEDPLEALTALFMDARYGPDEPGPDQVEDAEAASRLVCGALRVRRRPGRRAWRVTG